MNQTLLGLMVAVTVMGAQVARADDYDGDGYDDGYGYHPSVPVQQQQGGRGCGPRPTMAPRGQTMAQGQYQLQNVQRWVPGVQQQVWVPGQCTGGHRRHGRWGSRTPQCTGGYYTTVTTPGHYETTQQWVWVPSYQQPSPYYGGYGLKVQGANGSFSMSVY